MEHSFKYKYILNNIDSDNKEDKDNKKDKDIEMEADLIVSYVSYFFFSYFFLIGKNIITEKFEFNIQNHLSLMNCTKFLDNSEVRTAYMNFSGENFIFFTLLVEMKFSVNAVISLLKLENQIFFYDLWSLAIF